MRLRHIPGSEEQIAQSPYVIQNPQEYKGRWKEVFGNDNPIQIDTGHLTENIQENNSFASTEINNRITGRFPYTRKTGKEPPQKEIHSAPYVPMCGLTLFLPV